MNKLHTVVLYRRYSFGLANPAISHRLSIRCNRYAVNSQFRLIYHILRSATFWMSKYDASLCRFEEFIADTNRAGWKVIRIVEYFAIEMR